MRNFDLKPLCQSEWRPLFDEYGEMLSGIRGKPGACGDSPFGEIGVDLIRMKAGTAFPLHTHEGAHVLFVLEGEGCVEIDGKRYAVKRADSIFIAAEDPHAVSAPFQPCAFLAFGVPHKPIDAKNRMKIVEASGEETAA